MALVDYKVIGLSAPDLTEAEFVAILQKAGSPALSAASAVWHYCRRRGVSCAFLLAMFKIESRFGLAGTATQTRSWGNTRSPSFGGVQEMGTVPGRSGVFPVFRDWVDGGISTAARWLDHAPYQGKTTVRAILPVWAPASDGNSPEAYIAAVLSSITEWTGGQMGHVPQPRITKHPITKVVGVGRDPDLQRAPKFTVLHSMAGTLKGTDSYFPDPKVPALTDFGIGQVDAGGGFAEIIQWNDPFGTQIGWASGPVKVPQGDGPACLAAFGGAAGLNRYGVSIEHDDTTKADGTNSGKPGSQPVSAAQWSASCWLQAYIHAEWLGQTFATFAWNMHHLEFCGAAYKTCPNPRITDHTEEYQAAIKAIMRHFQGGAAYPAGGLVVAGLRLAAPPEATPAPVDTARVRAYVNDKSEAVLEVIYGGPATAIEGINIQDAGVSWREPDGAIVDRSIQSNVFQAKRKR
jgi:hypothetical protein